tara:strand:- start:6 stop:365 length:360 start_codon:yes stop_codon:yes gene_type:complete
MSLKFNKNVFELMQKINEFIIKFLGNTGNTEYIDEWLKQENVFQFVNLFDDYHCISDDYNENNYLCNLQLAQSITDLVINIIRNDDEIYNNWSCQKNLTSFTDMFKKYELVNINVLNYM